MSSLNLNNKGSAKITLLAGGVGGAKAAEGLNASRYRDGLSIIGNIGDDQAFHGLWVSPDIDTLTYSVGDRINREQGWGLAGDTCQVLDGLQQLGVDTWMQLGDLDFATHIYRTERRQRGERPQQIAQDIAAANGVNVSLILPTDDVVATRLRTQDGWLSFQDYFVRLRCAPDVLEVEYHNAEQAKANPEALTALTQADLIIIAPSNPILSIGAILAIDDLRTQLKARTVPAIAISPLIGGQAVKGPAEKIMTSLGMRADALGIAHYYQGLIDTLVIDSCDQHLQADIEALGIQVHVTNIWMKTPQDKERLMSEVAELALQTTVGELG